MHGACQSCRGSGRSSTSSAAPADQVDGRTEFEEGIGGWLYTIDTRDRVKDDVLLFSEAIRYRLRELERTQFKEPMRSAGQ